MELDLRRIAEQLLTEIETETRGVATGVKLLYDRIVREHEKLQQAAAPQEANDVGEARQEQDGGNCNEPVGETSEDVQPDKEEVSSI